MATLAISKLVADTVPLFTSKLHVALQSPENVGGCAQRRSSLMSLIEILSFPSRPTLDNNLFIYMLSEINFQSIILNEHNI